MGDWGIIRRGGRKGWVGFIRVWGWTMIGPGNIIYGVFVFIFCLDQKSREFNWQAYSSKKLIIFSNLYLILPNHLIKRPNL
jgi:hypothetical protein